MEFPLVVLKSVGEANDVRARIETDGRLSGKKQLRLKKQLLFLSVCASECECVCVRVRVCVCEREKETERSRDITMSKVITCMITDC